VRDIRQRLVNEGIKPFLDEADIRPADSWSTALAEQIKTVKSAAVFFGSHGVSRWQDRETTALLKESDIRRFPVIPVILASDTKPVVVPRSLEGLHQVDFSVRQLRTLWSGLMITGCRGFGRFWPQFQDRPAQWLKEDSEPCG
jgi:hypothetical protein